MYQNRGYEKYILKNAEFSGKRLYNLEIKEISEDNEFRYLETISTEITRYRDDGDGSRTDIKHRID